ncbi:hypothetical protein LRR18_09325 [Mangrovimonas sp. AS39]|uniref:hypothetical protein n=1 Tax=Mangrovimonas TaxID=1211036 RepID=UPI0006B5B69A|nr:MULTISPECIES: hypothetical protein [Mangrovimonas]MCF1191786.1 hypothetical protein [Mangrovimonas futianensis]MCF1195326.1 hypothetical protein [Mangrovimonas futianensis]NIK91789.1 hypothetical protein [Mangrovimonas sp. CR14]
MNQKKIKIFIVFATFVLAAVYISRINFDDLGWDENSTQYIGITAMLLVGIGNLIPLIKKKN